MSSMYTSKISPHTGQVEIEKNEQLTYGDLLNARSRPTDHRLDVWLSQLDDFGMLVLAAASLAS